MATDEINYQHYLAGEEKAAAVLVEKYGDRLTLYLNGYLQDMHEAEDLMIEAFSLVFAKQRPIAGAGSFKAYLYKTARNLTIRHKKKYTVPFICLDDLAFELQGNPPADAAVLQDEKYRQLYEALEQIKPEYREALYLVYFEGMNYQRAAAVMRKNVQQVTNLVHRGKQSLKKRLEQEGFTYENE